MTQQLETILASYAGKKRSDLLPLLWEVQTAFGHINREAVHRISHSLKVPEADIFGVIGFYSLFYHEGSAERVIRICTDPACSLNKAEGILAALEQETAADPSIRCEASTCLGMCDHAPAALISTVGEGERVVAKVQSTADVLQNAVPHAPAEQYLSEIGVLLKGYEATISDYGDYEALREVLHNRGSEKLIAEVEAAKLIGRGGAAFPTGLKWKYTRATQADRRYVVVNADESEPGTFKDRVLMESRPHLLLEGMLLAAYAIDATQGYIFIRGEYPFATQRLAQAIAEAQAAGFIGQNIMGSDFCFELEIRRGAGAYICGEETALFEAIEGKRGFPRIKPPYPTTHGLFQKPTVVNNVETLCNVPSIVHNGAEWFRSFGTEKSAGPKLLSVSGHVKRPGVYEINPGLTLRELLEGYCGGFDGELQAVLMGGAAGTFLRPDQLDIPLSFEDLRAAGSTFGSGAVMVFNQRVQLADVLYQLARFFQHESCGKCFPCQLGTQRQLEILEHPLSADDVQRLHDVGMTMTESSLCGLGQTAASAILSALEQWPQLIQEERA